MSGPELFMAFAMVSAPIAIVSLSVARLRFTLWNERRAIADEQNGKKRTKRAQRKAIAPRKEDGQILLTFPGGETELVRITEGSDRWN